MNLPNKLVVADGNLRTKDGSSLREYLAAWQSKHGFADIDVVILPRGFVMREFQQQQEASITIAYEYKLTLGQRLRDWIRDWIDTFSP